MMKREKTNEERYKRLMAYLERLALERKRMMDAVKGRLDPNGGQ